MTEETSRRRMTKRLPGWVWLLKQLVALALLQELLSGSCPGHDEPPPFDKGGGSDIVTVDWKINGTNDLDAACLAYGAERVLVTHNGELTAGSCRTGEIQFIGSEGTVTVNARLVDHAGAELATQNVSGYLAHDSTLSLDVDFQVPVTCRGTGTPHNTPINGPEEWLASASPHHVSGLVIVSNGARLTVEPGSTVCFGSGASLRFEGGAWLLAGDDPPAASVTFTGDYVSPTLPHVTWGQIQLWGRARSFIRNAIIEYASFGPTNDQTTPLTIDRTTIRTVNTPALIVFANSRVLSSTIDATQSDGSFTGRAVVELVGMVDFESRVKNAPVPGAAVAIYGQGSALSRCEIIGSARDGVHLYGASNASVTGCNLENNRGLAINNESNLLMPVIADDNWWYPAGGGDFPYFPRIDSPNGISERVSVNTVRSSQVDLGY